MSSDLSTVLDLSSNDFILFTNRDFISQDFLFDHLLHRFAKKGSELLLILLANNWSHYRSIAAKIGINLTTLKDRHTIKVIDILAEEQDFDYKRFVTDLDKHLSQLSSNSVLLIDDLSLFFTLGLNLVTVYKLVHKLRVSCLESDAILGIGTNYPSEEDDEEVNRFVSSIGHKCDILCHINKTSSGYSPLISGCLQITRRQESIEKRFNYKISDRNVKLLTFGSQLTFN